ncbi:MAG: DNA repair protein RadA [Chitinispirillaceae bacterium]|nr:DNA repair protein RadA [Chitinispirillaceae bacterium]
MIRNRSGRDRKLFFSRPMNRKTKTVYVCSSCGESFPKWVGKCENCGSWDTISEFREPVAASRALRSYGTSVPSITPLSRHSGETPPRIASSIPEIDRVLGGGLVRGAVILIGGDPGIGKSTLMLQLMAHWAGTGKKTLYVSGEESTEQIALRAARLGVGKAPLHAVTETSVEAVCAVLAQEKPAIVVVDSVQTLFSEQLESAPGSVSQIRESTALLLRFAKNNATALFLIGHVTKEGAIAGPRVLEHMVDTVLSFEGDTTYQFRIVRAVKNRFGPSGEIALLSMSDSGLVAVQNASEFFLLNRHEPQVGTAIVPIMEGSRILVVELQALCNRSHFGMPQRVASGIHPRRLSLLLAVLERHGGITIGDHDVFFNIAGGLAVAEPAIDLGIAAAILSSFRNRPLKRDLALIGELGLGGEVRPVNNMGGRLKELERMGFAECVVTASMKQADWKKNCTKLRLLPCRKIGELQEHVF